MTEHASEAEGPRDRGAGDAAYGRLVQARDRARLRIARGEVEAARAEFDAVDTGITPGSLRAWQEVKRLQFRADLASRAAARSEPNRQRDLYARCCDHLREALEQAGGIPRAEFPGYAASLSWSYWLLARASHYLGRTAPSSGEAQSYFATALDAAETAAHIAVGYREALAEIDARGELAAQLNWLAQRGSYPAAAALARAGQELDKVRLRLGELIWRDNSASALPERELAVADVSHALARDPRLAKMLLPKVQAFLRCAAEHRRLSGRSAEASALFVLAEGYSDVESDEILVALKAAFEGARALSKSGPTQRRQSAPVVGLASFDRAADELRARDDFQPWHDSYRLTYRARLVFHAAGPLPALRQRELYRGSLKDFGAAIERMSAVSSADFPRRASSLAYQFRSLATVQRHLARATAGLVPIDSDELSESADSPAAPAETNWTEVGTWLERSQEAAQTALRIADEFGEPLGAIDALGELALNLIWQGTHGGLDDRGGRRLLRPHLSALDEAEAALSDALARIAALVWGSQTPPPADALRPRTFQDALAKTPGLSQRLLPKIDFAMRNLAQCWALTGRRREAIDLVEEVLELVTDPRNRIRTDLRIGLYAEDVDLMKAVEVFERNFWRDAAEVAGDHPAADLRTMANEMNRFVHMLVRLKADRLAHNYRQRALDLLAGHRDAAAVRIRTKLARMRDSWDSADDDDRMDDRMAVKTAAPAADSEQGLAQTADLCGAAQNSIADEHPFDLAERLWDLAKACGRDHPDTPLPPPLALAVAKVLAAANAWGRPPLRVRRRFGPDFSTDAPRWIASFGLARASLQFAEHYAPGHVPRILGGLARWASRSPDPAVSGALRMELLGRAALSAAKLRDWPRAAQRYLDLARLLLQQGRAEEAARDASKAGYWLSLGLAWLGPGYDQLAALREVEPTAVALAELLVRASATAPDVFEAFERCKGNALAVLRHEADRARSDKDREPRRLLLMLEAREAVRASLLESQGRHGADLDATRLLLTQIRAELQARASLTQAPLPRLAAPLFRASDLERAFTRVEGPIAIAQYLCIGDEISVSVVRRDPPETPRYCSYVALGAVGREVRDRLRFVWDDLWRRDNERAARHLSRLHELLLAPLDEVLRGLETLVVIPHRELAGVPFHALRAPSGPNPYLIQRLAVAYAPSATLWYQGLEHGDVPHGEVLSLGWDADIEAADEARKVADSLDELAAHQVVGPGLDVATGVSRLLDPGKEYSVIHLSGHGELGDNPLDDKLRFDGTEVTAGEYLLRGARAQLVFANMCNAGRSTHIAGDAYGFSFALLASGSRSAVVVPVPIDFRPARDFVGRFYGKLRRRGTTKLRAFREVVLELIRMRPAAYGDPSAWGPYFFLGDSGPMQWSRQPTMRAGTLRKVSAAAPVS